MLKDGLRHFKQPTTNVKQGLHATLSATLERTRGCLRMSSGISLEMTISAMAKSSCMHLKQASLYFQSFSESKRLGAREVNPRRATRCLSSQHPLVSSILPPLGVLFCLYSETWHRLLRHHGGAAPKPPTDLEHPLFATSRMAENTFSAHMTRRPTEGKAEIL